MDRITKIFNSRKKVFIPYITAGYPSVNETVDIMNILVENGADIIELGFPFSDPTADGVIIQKSSQQALQSGFQGQDYFTIIEKFRANNTDTPLVVFGYFNPIFHFGIKAYVEKIKQLGGDAFIIVDLPFEEQEEVRSVLDEFGMHLIQLIAPTTDTDRARRILSKATGFVYQISLRGVTGVRSEFAADLTENVQKIKGITSLPIALGFGISRAEQINQVLPLVDAIVVGSAIVEVIHNNLPDFHAPLKNKVQELANAIHGDLLSSTNLTI